MTHDQVPMTASLTIVSFSVIEGAVVHSVISLSNSSICSSLTLTTSG